MTTTTKTLDDLITSALQDADNAQAQCMALEQQITELQEQASTLKAQHRAYLESPEPAEPGGQALHFQIDKTHSDIAWTQEQLTTAREHAEVAAARAVRFERLKGVKAGHSSAQQVRDALQRQEQALQQLQQRQGTAARTLATHPDDAEAMEDALLLDEQIEVTKRRIALYRQGVREAEETDRLADDVQRLEAAISARNAAVEKIQDCMPIAEQIEKHLEGLAPLIRKWQEAYGAVGSAWGDVYRLGGVQAPAVYGGGFPQKCLSKTIAAALTRARLSDVAPDVQIANGTMSPDGAPARAAVEQIAETIREQLDAAVAKIEV